MGNTAAALHAAQRAAGLRAAATIARKKK